MEGLGTSAGAPPSEGRARGGGGAVEGEVFSPAPARRGGAAERCAAASWCLGWGGRP